MITRSLLRPCLYHARKYGHIYDRDRVSLTNQLKTNTALGAVYGAFIGDAAGATLEFTKQGLVVNLVRALTLRGGPLSDSILVPYHYMNGDKSWAVSKAINMIGRGVWGVAPGQITDDGELTMCLIRALSKDHKWDLNTIAYEYCEWLSSGPFDVGQTTKRAINSAFAFKSTNGSAQSSLGARMYYGASMFNKSSEANGSLMRATPLGIYGHQLSDHDLSIICAQDSSLTHPNEVCRLAVTCYAMAIAYLVRKNSLVDPETKKAAFLHAKKWLSSVPQSKNRDKLLECFEMAQEGYKMAYGPSEGWVCIAFCHAFRHLYHNTPYLDAIRETLEGGGDTDTNACIVGGLLGAACGFDQLPQQQVSAVLNCNIKNGVCYHRPDIYHPKYAKAMIETIIKTLQKHLKRS